MLQFVHLVLSDEALLLSQLRTECFVARRARTGTLAVLVQKYKY
jgi:hypothetical protein